MKNTKSKIRFVEAFVIATFPLALVVGCSATGEQKPTEVSMQEDTTVQQEASINANQLNTLTFTESTESGSTNIASEQEPTTDSSPSAEESQQDVYAMDAAHTDDTASSETTMEDTPFTPVNMPIPEQPALDQPALDLPKVEQPDAGIFHFAVNKFDINEQDLALLQKHAEFLKENPGVTVNVNGYSDSRGPAKLNFQLSQKRAQQVADALINYGVSNSQIKVNSYGESFPLHDEKNWDENRRVELQYSEPSQDDGLMASASMH